MSKKAAVYTRTGDKGTTGLYTGERVSKCSTRVESYGNLDEITSAMSMMADVASLNLPQPYITEEHVKLFESTIDKFDAMLQPLSHFIIPGDSPGAGALDIARTTTRRAERQLLRLNETEPVNPQLLICVNRLSDLCFILARVETEVGVEKEK